MVDDRRDELSVLGALGLLAVGAIIGAGVALLVAPRSGEDTRDYLRERSQDLARRMQTQGADLARRAQETVQQAQSRAEDYLGRGKDVLEDTTAQLRAAFEAGRSAMRDEIDKLRGREEPQEGV